ncbi:hypothetical protein LTR37_001600 [Vermiconidia calcicola]|uniref:Uncharacterized protein n=1 Tax=Vermiconidia calcicola TaxID=1690605 RepID=A0ACC3NV64_9PEZI|nr:hypothetical protein LTR37_001600 [Vermiconidia calcicola]
MAIPDWDKLQKNVELICDIKFRNVVDHTEIKCYEDYICGICHTDLVSKNKTIVRSIAYFDDADEARAFFTDSIVPDLATAQLFQALGSRRDGDWHVRWFMNKAWRWDCPTCGADSNFLPSENDFDYTTQWTAVEVACCMEFFFDDHLDESSIRSARLGKPRSFCRDLRAAKRYAEARVQDANGVIGAIPSADFSSEVVMKDRVQEAGTMQYLMAYGLDGCGDSSWEPRDLVSPNALGSWLEIIEDVPDD